MCHMLTVLNIFIVNIMIPIFKPDILSEWGAGTLTVDFTQLILFSLQMARTRRLVNRRRPSCLQTWRSM